jgi:Putative DNA-binding domain
MAPELALGGLQRWLQVVIEAPGSVRTALRSREAARLVRPARTRDVVRPSHRGLSAAERVGIYQGMYLPRMMEALESDYEGLAHFLGPTAWTRLVRAYLTAHPSRSYTLNELGRRLPEFVRHARVPRAAFCHDLARLERAVAEVFDAPETKPLTEKELAALRPRDLERARLVPVAALRLLVLDHDAGAWLDSLRGDEHAHPPVRRKRTRVLVYRRS